MPLHTIQQLFERAQQHHRAGQLQQAEQLYRQILAQQPDHSQALYFRGLVAHQVGRNDIAADLIGRALAANPDWPEGQAVLGNALLGLGRFDDAIAAYRRALALQPAYAEVHNNLGIALKARGQLEEAIAACRQAIALKPDFPEAHLGLGNALKENGRADEALAAYRQALALDATIPEAHYNIGNTLRGKKQFAEAVAAYQRALALRPHYPDAHNNLGNVLKDQGQLDGAIGAYRQAVKLKPNFPEALNNLANALLMKGQLDEAIATYRQALVIHPQYADALNNLGSALKDKGQLDEAAAVCREAIALKPGVAGFHNNLANALKDKGQLDEAIAAYRQALVLNPQYLEAHSNLVTTLHYHPGFDAQSIAQEQRRWDQQHAEPLKKYIQPHLHDRTPRPPPVRLRIGYVSADLRDHVVARNLVPLFAHHDKTQFEIFAFAQVPAPDFRTQQIRQWTDHWHSIVGLSDEQAADLIRQNKIDILVDLGLHTANNRLILFARKPAPIQVTFAGYPGSTGLSAIDYRLSDPYLDPAGMDESIYSEKTIRLPDSFWCYDALDTADIPVNPLPALASNTITFGCLNSFCKINEPTLALWAKIMQQVKNSRLLLLAKQGDQQQRTTDFLTRQGIEAKRIEFIPRLSRRGYLECYHRIDISLDTFPYNGHTTSLDSFWMGVPVITHAGPTVVSRAGFCQLSNLGLAELAGHSPDQFIQIAADLANDLPRLQDLRATLRQKMQSSPLMNGSRFAKNIEAAYRQMWQAYQAPSPPN